MLYKFDKRRMDYVLAKDYFVKIVVGIIASWLVVFGLTSYNQSTKLNSIKYITEETRLLILNNENKFSEEINKNIGHLLKFKKTKTNHNTQGTTMVSPDFKRMLLSKFLPLIKFS
jgi:hypothetical protein